MRLMRYPSSKYYLNNHILPFFKNLTIDKNTMYVEPFAGSFAIGLKYLAKHPEITKVWINDKNTALTCLWIGIMKYLSEFQALLYEIKPTVPLFYKYKNNIINLKEMPSSTKAIINYGFQKLALHRWSYSGFGEFFGAPLGGKRQTLECKMNLCWSPTRIYVKLRNIKRVLENREVIITNYDFRKVLENTKSTDILYLDPPHYTLKKKQKVFQLNLNVQDHSDLATMLKNSQSQWILSYDFCPTIQQLYSWAKLNEILVSHNMTKYVERHEYIIHK